MIATLIIAHPSGERARTRPNLLLDWWKAEDRMGTTESVENTDTGVMAEEEVKVKRPKEASNLPDEFTRRFEVLEVIGKGSFGCVFKVKDIKTKGVYATKYLEYNSSNMKEVKGLSRA